MSDDGSEAKFLKYFFRNFFAFFFKQSMNKSNQENFEKEFVLINNKFYEVIESNKNFSLLADTYLEIYYPDYTPGIQDKPDPKYRKKNSVFLYYNDKFNYVERRKSFLISMFDKNVSKDVNTFIKKN